MGAGQQGVVWAVRPGVVGGVAARLRLRSELRPSLRLRRPATPLEYRCQGDISKSVNRVTFLLRYNIRNVQGYVFLSSVPLLPVNGYDYSSFLFTTEEVEEIRDNCP